MLHAVIIDDEINGLQSLELLIEKYVPEVRVVASATEAGKGVQLINDYRPDIVFLDINMPGMNGFEVLEKIEFRKFSLIFTTSYQEYSLKAIKQNALDYLLKPIDKEELRTAVHKALRKENNQATFADLSRMLEEMNRTAAQRITVPTRHAIELVNPVDILYIEASSNQTILTLTTGQKLFSTRSLKEYEEILDNTVFFLRIHNSYIINTNYVSSYLRVESGYALMKDGYTIPVSKNRKEAFLKLIQYKPE